MNYGLSLGRRSRAANEKFWDAKQFLEVFGKPIIIYTLEKFEKCEDIDKIVISCNASWIEYMNSLINQYRISKILEVVLGGKNRQEV